MYCIRTEKTYSYICTPIFCLNNYQEKQMEKIMYIIPAFGLVGLIVMWAKSAWVSSQDAGDEKMQELAGYIANGAMAFLKAEWKILTYFAIFTCS